MKPTISPFYLFISPTLSPLYSISDSDFASYFSEKIKTMRTSTNSHHHIYPVTNIIFHSSAFPGFPGGAVVMNLPASIRNMRDTGLIPGLGRSPRIGNSNPLQYSCLENSMDREAWWATIHVFTKSQTWLSAHEYSFPSVLLSKVNFAKHFTNIMFTYSPSDPMRPVFMILFYIWGYRFKVTSLERICCNTVLPTTLLLKRQLRGLW